MDKIKESASKFVPGGSLDKPNERDDEWHKVEEELEEERKRKFELGKQQDGKSLYEALQANKDAKQQAFEESIKLKNQFRPLDDDEVEFLDTVTKSQRAKEEAVKQETDTQLDSFRRQQVEAERHIRASDGQTPSVSSVGEWEFPGRKRKKREEKGGLQGIKLRKTSTQDSATDIQKATEDSESQEKIEKEEEKIPEKVKAKSDIKTQKPVVSSSLGLGAYSSDEDE